MILSSHNPLLEKLVTLSAGDIDVLQAAVRDAANGSRVADLKMVVDNIVLRRRMMEQAAANTAAMPVEDAR